MTTHRVTLSNGSIVLLEERTRSLHIATETEGFPLDIDTYICTIEPLGVTVMPNSGDATTYLTRNLPVKPCIALLCEDNGFDEDCFRTLSACQQECFDHYKGWALDTHCGGECVKIMEAAKPLLAIADPAARPRIWHGIINAMGVICAG